MELQLAATSLHWSQPSVPQSPSSSSVSSPSPRRRSFSGGDGTLFCNYHDRSVLLCGSGRRFSKLHRSQSCEFPKNRSVRRALSSGFDSFSDEDFSRRIEELSLGFNDEDHRAEDEPVSRNHTESEARFRDHPKPFDVPETPERVEIIPANFERKANSVEIPFSLRVIRRKMQWQDGGFDSAGETAYCSVKRAFSSMVFIIRELHRFTIEMREILFYEDLQGILANVQKEIHASFVWLFQKVFSHTPTLMVYVMILLANYGAHSIAEVSPLVRPAAAASSAAASACTVVAVEDRTKTTTTAQKFDPLSNSSAGKTSSVGGGGGGGGKFRPVAGNAEGGDDRFEESENAATPPPIEEALKLLQRQGEAAVDDRESTTFVSPDHSRTDLLYRIGLAGDPENPLLLANYAQFLCLATRDFDRCEEYFRRAVGVEPKDADSLNKYANFLWKVREDVERAEEMFLEAIEAEPKNSFYAADYAHFLWSTGGEDTCYPLT